MVHIIPNVGLELGEEVMGNKIHKSGIYQITNKVNGKFYIGSSIQIEIRWKQHINALKKGNHCNKKLQNSWNKYGEQAFEFSILEETNDLINREQFYVNELKPELNICVEVVATALGVKRSPESIAQRNRTMLERYGALNFTTPDSNLKRSMTQKGRPSPLRGRKLSPQHIEQMRLNNLGRKPSPETRKLWSEQRRGRAVSEQQKEAIRKTLNEKKPAAILSREDVQVIRGLKGTVSYGKLAHRFNVARSTIQSIMEFRTWKDV